MTKSNSTVSSYGVTMQPKTYQGLLRGIEKVVNAVRPTLGPYPRMVALSTQSSANRSPELMDDGGLIARRIIQLPDRDEDIGAMFLRNQLWRMREDHGDGTATLAVLFDYVVRQGLRHIVHGGNAMPLRRYLEQGARLVLEQLQQMTMPVEGQKSLAKIAESICSDPEMAEKLSEIFETISAYGHLELRTGNGRGLEVEYVQGSFWESELHSMTQVNIPGEKKAQLHDCAVLVTDFMVEDLHHVVRMITEAKRAGATSLFLICNGISETCIGFLNTQQTRDVLPVIAAKTPPGNFDQQVAAMEDIALLTGGVPLTRHAGETLESVRQHHFGKARSVWTNHQFLGIVGGKGDPKRLKAQLRSLKNRHAVLEAGDERELIRQRIGKLMGGSAVLWAGGATDAEMNVRKDMASRAAEAVRGAILRGCLPGGGMALLACKPALKQAMERAENPDEKAAYRILLGAMDVPLRTIVSNAGMSPDEIMAYVKMAGDGYGYDVRKRQVVSCSQTEVIDAASIVQAAAVRAINSAALILTVDVLVRHKKPETVVDT